VRAALNDQTVSDENAGDMRVAKRGRSLRRGRLVWRRGGNPVRASTSSDRSTPTRVNAKETDDRSSGQRYSAGRRRLAKQAAADAEFQHCKYKGDSDGDASTMVTGDRALAEEMRRAYEASRREELAADADDLGSSDSEQNDVDSNTYESDSFVDKDVVDESNDDDAYAPTGGDDENSEEEEEDEDDGNDDDEDDDDDAADEVADEDKDDE
jgi:hypothetical protein